MKTQVSGLVDDYVLPPTRKFLFGEQDHRWRFEISATPSQSFVQGMLPLISEFTGKETLCVLKNENGEQAFEWNGETTFVREILQWAGEKNAAVVSSTATPWHTLILGTSGGRVLEWNPRLQLTYSLAQLPLASEEQLISLALGVREGAQLHIVSVSSEMKVFVLESKKQFRRHETQTHRTLLRGGVKVFQATPAQNYVLTPTTGGLDKDLEAEMPVRHADEPKQAGSVLMFDVKHQCFWFFSKESGPEAKVFHLQWQGAQVSFKTVTFSNLPCVGFWRKAAQVGFLLQKDASTLSLVTPGNFEVLGVVQLKHEIRINQSFRALIMDTIFLKIDTDLFEAV